jgi:glycosyltransferase involved in cell wall biosynthesis
MGLLSIYIPTWNRPHLLDRLLASIEPQMCDEVDVFVSVNKSDKPYNIPSWVKHRELRRNIGGDPNICVGPTLVNGTYCWVIGDDEQMLPGAIESTLQACRDGAGLILQPSGKHNIGVALGSTYPTYAAFCDALIGANAGWVIAAHTLISATTFQRDAYDVALALQKMDTMYGFHYGMLANLMFKPVHVLPQPTMLYGREASVFLHSKEIVDEHMSAYPKVIHDIFDWVGAVTGYLIPHDEFKRGFDT